MCLRCLLGFVWLFILKFINCYYCIPVCYICYILYVWFNCILNIHSCIFFVSPETERKNVCVCVCVTKCKNQQKQQIQNQATMIKPVRLNGVYHYMVYWNTQREHLCRFVSLCAKQGGWGGGGTENWLITSNTTVLLSSASVRGVKLCKCSLL